MTLPSPAAAGDPSLDVGYHFHARSAIHRSTTTVHWIGVSASAAANALFPLMQLLGGFEQAVLLAVARLRADAYGRAILADVRQKLGHGVTSGAVYVTLDRLEAKGLITSRSTSSRRRYFAVLSSGTRALEETKETFDRIWDGFE